MVRCEASSCQNRSSRKSKAQLAKEESEGVSTGFFRFPAEPEVRRRWIQAVGIRSWLPNAASRLCSDHFTEGSFVCKEPKFTLKKDAVPVLNCDVEPPSKIMKESSGVSFHPAFNPSLLLNGEIKFRLSQSNVQFPSGENNLEIAGASTYQIHVPEPSAYDNIEEPFLRPETTFHFLEPLLHASNLNESIASISVEPDVDDTPRKRKLKKKIQSLQSEKLIQSTNFKRKINTLRVQNHRLKKQVCRLKNVIAELKKRKLVSVDGLEALCNISAPNEEFLMRQLSKTLNQKKPRKYGLPLRAFALTLQYHSSAAYDFVRSTFNSALPHPRTLSKWYAGIDGSPGFSVQALESLQKMANLLNKVLICTFVFDEMSIRRCVETDGKTYFGYEDLGFGQEGDDRPLATQALVFMIVPLNDKWKLPIAYFLISGMTGEQKATLIKNALYLTDRYSILTKNVTCDGPASNFAMGKSLGADLDPLSENFQPWFFHPFTGERIFITFDACHMVKLVRNSLEKFRVLVDGNGNRIEWRYLEFLFELQDSEGLVLANKLKKKHIKFHLQKMKVYLATQLLSNSVADALQTCIEIGFPQFRGCEPLIKFLKIFNNLFDVCNSKSLRQPKFKKPINEDNFEETKIFLEESTAYIKELSLEDGTNILKTQNKTGFRGFIILAKNLVELYNDVCKEGPMTHLSTYKLSQDHLEMFFGNIRARGGFNNNPTCRQFIAAYKRNLLHMQLKPSSHGNCLPLEEVPILSISSSPDLMINMSSGIRMKHDDLESFEHSLSFEDDPVIHPIDYKSLSLFKRTVNVYMAGWVVHLLSGSLKCGECRYALTEYPVDRNCELIQTKNRGGLITPSVSTVKVINASELIFESKLNQSGKLPPEYTEVKLVSIVMRHFFEGGSYSPLFPGMDEHVPDIHVLLNHKYLLIRSIAMKYMRARVGHHCRNVIDASQSVRALFCNQVQFRHE